MKKITHKVLPGQRINSTLSYRRWLAKPYAASFSGMHINQFLHNNYARLNDDPFLQGLALGFWEAKFTCLEYKLQNMKESLNITGFRMDKLNKNIHYSATRIIRQLNDFKPHNQHCELFKQLLLLKYNKLLSMTFDINL